MNIYIDGLSTEEIGRYHFERRLQEQLRPYNQELHLFENFHFVNVDEFIQRINEVFELQIPPNRMTLTICCHGEPEILLAGNNRSIIRQNIIIPQLLRLKQKFPTLIVILCVCEGASLEFYNENEPFVFSFTCKISLQAAMDCAAIIINQNFNNTHLEQIELNIREYLINNHRLLVKTF